MKKAKELLNFVIATHIEDIDCPWYEDGIYDGSDYIILQAIKLAQQNAIEHTLKVAAEKAEVRIKYDSVKRGELNGYSNDKIWIRDQDGSGCNLYTDKNSILSLKDELFKELEDES